MSEYRLDVAVKLESLRAGTGLPADLNQWKVINKVFRGPLGYPTDAGTGFGYREMGWFYEEEKEAKVAYMLAVGVFAVMAWDGEVTLSREGKVLLTTKEEDA